ncbi:dihydrodipicolinate synthase family protein [Caldinitratiruptor microaerophilus]|uniref:Dihydrodipicolinate synthase family protein n=1 Tax=Caldinitratiruptor microaerophilus TaxID=671077 RepID=A0AA35CKB8_9FIRM|nr:dihydrodipicolinate synthase family protein [Caldinitratiruptor microaerophilus]BDG60899.1 dihydrodipicolinate synthase family protein [Caldinitratiruptor microaerophilus]
MKRFTGVFAPIPTPFDANEEVAYPQLKENLARWARTRLAGLVVFGSNGESVLLDAEEKERLIAFVREHFPSDRPVIAGTGAESTRETIRLTRRAAELGASAALVLNPTYYKGSMNEEVLARFFLDVAEASPIPVMIYNMPRNTGINLPASLVVRLASHPNIVGVKDSGGDITQIAEIVAGAPADFAVFAGSASFLLPTIVVGGVGGTLAAANVIPDLCAEIVELAQAGRIAEARELQLRILAVNKAVTASWGVAGLKAALDLIGYYGGPPRRPLQPLGEAAREELRQILRAVGALEAGS